MHSDSMPPLRQRGDSCYAATPSASSRLRLQFLGVAAAADRDGDTAGLDQILDAYETFARTAETHALKVLIEA